MPAVVFGVTAAGARRFALRVLQLIFGDFVLDALARTLRHRGSAVALRPKEFGLLLLLVSSQGAAVSKDSIVEAVWKHADVSDAAITQNVYRLRKILAARDPHTGHIAAVPGVGYRFVPPVATRSVPGHNRHS